MRLAQTSPVGQARRIRAARALPQARIRWDERYLSPRMRAQIERNAYLAPSRVAGVGQFARRDLGAGTVVGYFSGRVLNARTRHDADPEFIAGGTWDHPETGRRLSYVFEVMSPSRYMNAGIHPRYLGARRGHPMTANARLLAAAQRVKGRYRLVLVLRTLRPVAAHDELLLDYGILHHTIYYEYLRRRGAPDSPEQWEDYESCLEARYREWRAATQSRSRRPAAANHEFLESFARRYFAEP